MRYDLIVVGAGPAGSTVARECAGQGFSVLLLDKAVFPRDKPCGGGVTLRAARLLPFDLSPVTERSVTGIEMTLRGRQGLICDAPQPIAYLTQRSRFDHFLMERAVKEGAILRERLAIREIERQPSHLIVRAGNETFTGRTLVVADGANGETARRAGLAVPKWRGIAIEGNLIPSGPFPDRWRERMGIDLGGVAGGYSWIFPKGDHLNIGLGGIHSVGSVLRRRLEEVVRFSGFDPAFLHGVRAHPLPIRRKETPLVDGNLLLVGDAAGLIDMMTGEGIYSALWSGQAAAKHLSAYLIGTAPDPQGYRREVERDLLPELRISFQLWSLFHLMPIFLTKFLLHDGSGPISRTIGWPRLRQILQGEERFEAIKRDLFFLWPIVDRLLPPSLFPSISRFLGVWQR
ncbi:MAG: NAD(P)/FAD-dependent oxidoreductase [Candidatus Manganitrophaceae bacterium]